MIGEHSWITFLCCQCRCQIFKGERYFRTVFYYNFQTVLVAIVCLKAETSHYGAARGFYRPSLLVDVDNFGNEIVTERTFTDEGMEQTTYLKRGGIKAVRIFEKISQ